MSFQVILQMAMSGILPSLFIGIIVYSLYYVFKHNHSRSIACMIFYLSMLFYVTIYRYGIQIDELFNMRPMVNIVPLVSTYELYLFSGWVIFLYNIIGNICWFLPFGFLLPYIHKDKRFFQILFCSFLLSMTIEIFQFILNCGISDIDDIIFNMIGGSIGYVIYLFFQKLKK